MESLPEYKRIKFSTYSAKEVQLLQELDFNCEYGSIHVPSGFISDGASIPWWCWSIIKLHPLDPRVIRAAITHDWLYRTQDYSKKEADMIFYSILAQDIDRARAYILYRAVCISIRSNIVWRRWRSELNGK